MKNSDLLLFFFILYDFIVTGIFLIIYYDMKKKIKENEDYIDELFFELEKARRK